MVTMQFILILHFILLIYLIVTVHKLSKYFNLGCLLINDLYYVESFLYSNFFFILLGASTLKIILKV